MGILFGVELGKCKFCSWPGMGCSRVVAFGLLQAVLSFSFESPRTGRVSTLSISIFLFSMLAMSSAKKAKKHQQLDE